jgi:hypothetical protein
VKLAPEVRYGVVCGPSPIRAPMSSLRRERSFRQETEVSPGGLCRARLSDTASALHSRSRDADAWLEPATQGVSTKPFAVFLL